MIGYYKYTRDQIVKYIKKSQKTCDGYYFAPRFDILNSKTGNLDGENDKVYYFPREYFNNKICFSEDDIGAYLSKKKIDYDIEKMNKLDNAIYDVIKDIRYLNLEDEVDNKDFNLNELIDTTIYIYKVKNF
jgi:hypothetical protein